MYRIMIVDDEPIIRKGLVSFIDWESINCEIVYEAIDGTDAKEQLVQAAPDIIITDIKMPGMDGIELAKYVYEHCRNIKVIMLTGFADFEYACAAIKYGVVDFVLKPTSTDKILEAVGKAKKVIELETEKDNKIKTLEEKMNESTSEIQEKFIHELIDGIVLDKAEIYDKAKKLSIQLDNFYAVLFELDTTLLSSQAPAAIVDEKRDINALKNVISMAFKDILHYNVVIKSSTICTLVSFDSSRKSESMQLVLTICSEIVEMAENFMRYTISAGISHRHSTPLEVQQAFKEASNAISLMFYDDTKNTIHMAYPASVSHIDSSFTKKYIDLILENVQKGNGSQAAKELHEMLDILKHNKSAIENIKNISILLCSLCSKLLNNHNLIISSETVNSSNMYSSILESKSISSLSELLTEIVLATSVSLGTKEHQIHYIIRKAIDYLNRHFNENITLSAIANSVHVNGSYLSRLFKKETGETLTEAIASIRIEKAKELLLETDKKTYEIAAMVGIDDPAYFSQLFKKHTGMNPKDYKRATD